MIFRSKIDLTFLEIILERVLAKALHEDFNACTNLSGRKPTTKQDALATEFLFRASILLTIHRTYATHLAISDATNPILQLGLHKRRNVLVLGRAEVFLCSLFRDDVLTDLENLLGAKETADVVGSV